MYIVELDQRAANALIAHYFNVYRPPLLRHAGFGPRRPSQTSAKRHKHA